MTILIVGGAAQGKSAFARRISPETEIVDNLQDITIIILVATLVAN